MSFLRGLISAGVRNPVYANMLMICILAGGIYAARGIVRETYPEFSLDTISIEVPYPGANPKEVEQGVIVKVEEAIEGLPGIKKVYSRATEDGGLTLVELNEGVDPRLMILDVKERLDRITTFPSDADEPVVTEMLIRSQAINVAISGDLPERTLRVLADEVKNDLLADPDISQIEVTGIRDYEIAIEVSREALLKYGLTLDQVAGIVRQNTLDTPAGTLRTGAEELTLRTTGQRYTARDFEDLVLIAQPDGTLIRLGQVATVTDGFEETYKSGRFNGQPAVMLEVYKTPEQDTSTIARHARDYVARKQKSLARQVHLDVWGDASREVDARIDMLARNGLQGAILVILVLTLFLDFRVSWYVALGIPISFAGALIIMHFLGMTFNMISLFGLIMATGIIVDDAIVIADGYREERTKGVQPALAAIEGTSRMALPVLAASLTTVVAFVPLLFVEGIMGKFVAVLPIVVISTVIFSGIEAFAILPSHLQHCMRPNATTRQNWRTRARAGIERRIDRFVERAYRPFCARAVRYRAITLAIAFTCLLVAGGLVVGGRTPFTLLPEIDGDMLRARVRLPEGVPVERTEAAVRQLEVAADAINHDPDLRRGDQDIVLRKFSVIGEWSGWLNESGSHLCEVMIEVQPAEHRAVSSDEILAAWRKATGTIDDAVAVVYSPLARGPAEKPLDVRLLGDNLDQLRQAADDVADQLRQFAGVSGVEHDLQPGKREIRVTLRPLARTLGITLDDLATELRSGFYGGEAVRVQRGRDDVRVQVRYPRNERQSVADIESVRIRGAAGNEVPFHEIADYKVERGYAAIRHEEGRRRVQITANLDERLANAERILGELETGVISKLPQKYPGIEYRLEGQRAQMRESMRSLFRGFALALVVIYALLAAILRSYVQPVVIMAAIPLGLVGAVVGHWLLGYDLTMLSLFGMVGISGVVVNDSLVLLDRINENTRSGRTVLESTLEAGGARFRAVLLTTVTTVMGLAPLMTERSTQAKTLIPMAISLTFGLAFATALTLLVVPALHLALNDMRRLARWLRRGGEYPSPEAIESLSTSHDAT